MIDHVNDNNTATGKVVVVEYISSSGRWIRYEVSGSETQAVDTGGMFIRPEKPAAATPIPRYPAPAKTHDFGKARPRGYSRSRC